MGHAETLFMRFSWWEHGGARQNWDPTEHSTPRSRWIARDCSWRGSAWVQLQSAKWCKLILAAILISNKHLICVKDKRWTCWILCVLRICENAIRLQRKCMSLLNIVCILYWRICIHHVFVYRTFFFKGSVWAYLILYVYILCLCPRQPLVEDDLGC